MCPEARDRPGGPGLLQENDRLRARLEEAEQALNAIRHGDIDALVVDGPAGSQVYTLTTAEHVYRVIVETMHEGALTTTPDGRILFCNRRFCTLVQAPMADVIGRQFQQFTSSPHRADLGQLFVEAWSGSAARCLDLALPGGASVPVQIAGSRLAADGGQSLCLIVSDLSDLVASAESIQMAKENEAALVEANARLQDQALEMARRNSVLAGINRIFREGLTCETEEQFGAVCLTVAEEVTGSRFGFIGEINPRTGRLDCIAISDPGWTACLLNASEGSAGQLDGFEIHGLCGRVLKDGKGYFTNRPAAEPDSIGTPAGHPAIRAFLGVPLVEQGRTVGMIAVANRDGGYRGDDQASLEALADAVVQAIMRRRADLELERVRSVLAEGQRIAHLGTFEYDAATRTTNWSEEEYRIYGLDPAGPSPDYEDILARCIHPEDAALLHRTFATAMENASIYELEHRIVRPDGSVRWVYDRAHPHLDANGKLVRYVGATLDITDRKLAEKELRARHAELLEFNELMVDRELRMIELKKEINGLCERAGQPVRYEV